MLFGIVKSAGRFFERTPDDVIATSPHVVVWPIPWRSTRPRGDEREKGVSFGASLIIAELGMLSTSISASLASTSMLSAGGLQYAHDAFPPSSSLVALSRKQWAQRRSTRAGVSESGESVASLRLERRSAATAAICPTDKRLVLLGRAAK